VGVCCPPGGVPVARPGQSYHSTPRQVWVKALTSDTCASPGCKQGQELKSEVASSTPGHTRTFASLCRERFFRPSSLKVSPLFQRQTYGEPGENTAHKPALRDQPERIAGKPRRHPGGERGANLWASPERRKRPGEPRPCSPSRADRRTNLTPWQRSRSVWSCGIAGRSSPSTSWSGCQSESESERWSCRCRTYPPARCRVGCARGSIGGARPVQGAAHRAEHEVAEQLRPALRDPGAVCENPAGEHRRSGIRHL